MAAEHPAFRKRQNAAPACGRGWLTGGTRAALCTREQPALPSQLRAAVQHRRKPEALQR